MTQISTREKFIAVVGLPRSGTTLLTALLDQHTSLCLYYEPWNASRNIRPPVPRSLEEFRTCMQTRFGAEPSAHRRTTGFKETTTNSGTTGWAVATIDALSPLCEMHVIWIQRDPIHCLLSKIEGAKKWWGYSDAQFSRASLEQFLLETEKSYEVLGGVQRRHGGLVVRYEALVREPAKVLADIMQTLGENFEISQLDYYKFDSQSRSREKIMGDPRLIESPSAVSVAPIARRDHEAAQYRAIVDEVFGQARFEKLGEIFTRYAALPAVARVQLDFEP